MKKTSRRATVTVNMNAKLIRFKQLAKSDSFSWEYPIGRKGFLNSSMCKNS
jgi:hypothetical protein